MVFQLLCIALCVFLKTDVSNSHEITIADLEKNLFNADSLFEIEQFEESRILFQKALVDARTLDRMDLAAYALKGLGNIAYTFFNLEKAEHYYRDALEIFQGDGDRRGEVKIYNNLGIISEERRAHKEALKYYRNSLDILEKSHLNGIEDRKDKVALLGNIGHLFEVQVDLDSALYYYRISYEMAHKIGYVRGEADALHNTGNVHHRILEFDSAQIYYGRSMKIFETAGNNKAVADNLRELGAVKRKQGRYGEALALLEQALKILREIQEEGQIRGEAETINSMALVYQEIGKHKKALEYLKEVKGLYELRNDSVGTAIALENIANTYFELSMQNKMYADSAVNYHNKSLIIFRKTGEKKEEANAVNNKGLVFQRTGNVDKALTFFNEALSLHKEMHNTVGQAYANSNIGNVYMIQQDYDKAIYYYQVSIGLIEKHKLPVLRATSFASLGIAYRDKEQDNEAINMLKTAIDIIEDIRGGLVTQEFKSSFIEDKIRIYEELIALLLKKGKIEEAFHYVERAKARALLDLIGGKAIAMKKLPSEIQKLVDSEKKLSRKLEFLDDEEERRDVFIAYKDVLNELQDKYPEYHSLRRVEPLDLKTFQGKIDEKTIVLEYFLCHKGIYLFAIDHKNMSAQKLSISPHELYNKVEMFRSSILDFETVTSIGWDLYRQLVMVVEDELKDKERVCIIPHGILHHLPFTALIVAEDSMTYFVERYNIFYAPSGSVFAIAHEKNTGKKKKSVIFAKSDFSDHSGWSDLAGTVMEKEILVKKKLLPGVTTYVNLEATEDKLKEVIGQYDIIHLATHGELNREQPLQSRILLTLTKKNDGSLTVREIFGLDLSSYLVTLSACETGEIGSYIAGKEFSSGDDLVGLTRALIFAGTPSVIASLWYVSDASTVLLMENLYRNLKKRDKAFSLCEAQRYMIQQTDYSLPFFWAPFVLFGDWK